MRILYGLIILSFVISGTCWAVYGYQDCSDWLVKRPQRGVEIEGEYIEGWHGVKADGLIKDGEDIVQKIVNTKQFKAHDAVYGKALYFYSHRPENPDYYPFAAWIHFRVKKETFLQKGWSALLSTPKGRVSPERLVPAEGSLDDMMDIEVLDVFWNEKEIQKARKIYFDTYKRDGYELPDSYQNMGQRVDESWPD